jgi:hypothetical protein
MDSDAGDRSLQFDVSQQLASDNLAVRFRCLQRLGSQKQTYSLYDMEIMPTTDGRLDDRFTGRP